MANRGTFERRNRWVTEAGQNRHATEYYVTCSSCGDQAAFLVNKFSGTAPPELIHKYFQNKGWLLGKSATHDLCPKCIKIKVDERRAARIEHDEAKDRAAHTLSREARAKVAAIPPAANRLPSNLTEADREIAVRLLTRMEILRSEIALSQGTIVGLFDRLAAAEKEIEGLGPAIHAMTSLSAVDLTERIHNYEEEDEMFRKLISARPVGRAMPGRIVRIGFGLYNTKASDGTPRLMGQTRIMVSGELANELGYRPNATPPDRAAIAIGEGDHAGMVMVERTKERNGSLWVDIRPSTNALHITIAAVSLAPADKNTPMIPMTQVNFQIVEGNLVFKLPDEFLTISKSTSAFAAAKSALG